MQKFIIKLEWNYLIYTIFLSIADFLPNLYTK